MHHFQAITEAGKTPEKEKTFSSFATLIASLQIYGIAVAVAESLGARQVATASIFHPNYVSRPFHDANDDIH